MGREFSTKLNDSNLTTMREGCRLQKKLFKLRIDCCKRHNHHLLEFIKNNLVILVKLNIELLII